APVTVIVPARRAAMPHNFDKIRAVIVATDASPWTIPTRGRNEIAHRNQSHPARIDVCNWAHDSGPNISTNRINRMETDLQRKRPDRLVHLSQGSGHQQRSHAHLPGG